MADVRRGVRFGVDVGSVRVGLARSDASGALATPVRTLRRRPDDDGTAEIAAEVAAADAVEVVVGLPRTLSGQVGAAAQEAMAYASLVARAVRPVPVRLVDERLTTVTAHQALHGSGRRGRKHREVVDQVAAVLILQGALDLERSTGRPPGDRVPTDEGDGEAAR